MDPGEKGLEGGKVEAARARGVSGGPSSGNNGQKMSSCVFTSFIVLVSTILFTLVK